MHRKEWTDTKAYETLGIKNISISSVFCLVVHNLFWSFSPFHLPPVNSHHGTILGYREEAGVISKMIFWNKTVSPLVFLMRKWDKPALQRRRQLPRKQSNGQRTITDDPPLTKCLSELSHLPGILSASPWSIWCPLLSTWFLHLTCNLSPSKLNLPEFWRHSGKILLRIRKEGRKRAVKGGKDWKVAHSKGEEIGDSNHKHPYSWEFR